MVSAPNPRVLLPIVGMTCDHCRSRVERALREVPGVAAATVDLAAATAEVTFAGEAIERGLLEQAVQEAGFRVGELQPQAASLPRLFSIGGLAVETPTSIATPTVGQATPATESLQRYFFLIRGMHCASCVGNVEQALRQQPGVRQARVNLPLQQAVVDVASGDSSPQSLIAAVTAAGYAAEEIAEQASQQVQKLQADDVAFWRARFWLALACLLPLLLTHGFAGMHAFPAVASFVLATVVQIIVGGPYLWGAWQRLRHRSANMDTLVAIGTSAAFLAGCFNPHAAFGFMESMMILTFITLGKYLEALSKGRASRALWKLLDLTPPTARVLTADGPQLLPVRMVSIGERIVIAPGERVPLDAKLEAGKSDVDEAWLTGESLPVVKEPGGALYAGTINLSGALTAVVTQPADNTSLAQAVRLLREAQESKGEYQDLADRIVAWFVPTVLVIAAVTFVAWWLSSANGWQQGLECAVAVLVVACPCALGLAMPTALLVATGRGAELGILIKSSQALEAAERVTQIVLDKTGTITRGQPLVVDLVAITGVSRRELLTWGAAAEQGSGHPFARAILQAAEREGIQPVVPRATRVLPGIGLEAETELGVIRVGNREIIPADVTPATNWPTIAGATTLYLTRNHELQGAIYVADAVAATSAAAIASFQAQGLQVHMLSGDQRATAVAIAAQVGIPADHVQAGVTPAGKLEFIQQLQQSGAQVAMIGDGINDAPALATADLGIAIGAGAEIALESADIVLLRSDLASAVIAFQLARRTMHIIRQNLAWAWGYNLILIPFAAGLFIPWWGLSLPPVWAAAAMASSSVTVVLNSLRIGRAGR